MKNRKVDLHIHSFYSDGTMSPNEIIQTAIKKNVGIIAITDHDTIEGVLEMSKLEIGSEIIYISGIELDSVESGINYHILGYSMDIKNERFQKFVKKNRELLENVNEQLIKKMQENHVNISIEDYLDFSYDKKKGGWKALHYFKEKAITNNLFDGIFQYSKYNHSYNCVDFPDIKEVCKEIHLAGGKAVLAHPGKVIKTPTIEEFEKELRRILEFGIDGIECYYPSHSDKIIEACLKICEEKDILITTGSDCHGEFENTEIGETEITLERLRLGDLLEKSNSF